MKHALPWSVLWLSLAPLHLCAQSYLPHPLEQGNSLQFGAALARSEGGRVAGVASPNNGPGSQAFVWTETGQYQLPLFAGDSVAIAFGINDVGQAIGTSTKFEQVGQLTYITDRPALWSASGLVDINTLVSRPTGLEIKSGVAINDAGMMLVRARDPLAMTLQAAVLSEGVLTAIPGLGGFGGSEPYNLSAQGDVLGSAPAVAQFPHAFHWKDGLITDLHAQAGVPGRVSSAWDMNRLGEISGAADFVADFIDFETCCVWRKGVATNYGTLGGQQAFGQSINDLGMVVGSTNLVGGEARAFLLKNGVLQDLNDLIPPGSGWVLTAAEEINNDLRIVGQGLFQGELVPYVLEPVCTGSAQAYGAGCAGAGGALPELLLLGCPAAGNRVVLEVAEAPALGLGFLVLGTGSESFPLLGACALEIAPLLPTVLVLHADAQGSMLLPIDLDPNAASATVQLQSVWIDALAPEGLRVSNALAVVIG